MKWFSLEDKFAEVHSCIRKYQNWDPPTLYLTHIYHYITVYIELKISTVKTAMKVETFYIQSSNNWHSEIGVDFKYLSNCSSLLEASTL